MVFEVTDDSGFLAIIDPDAYRGFVHADWTWDTIQEHFRREMRDRHLLIWANAPMKRTMHVALSVADRQCSLFKIRK